MELRKRAAMLPSPKMATVKEKRDLQTMIEAMDKKLMDALKEIGQKIEKVEDTQIKCKGTMMSEVAEVKKEIAQITTDLQSSSQKIAEIEQRTADTNKKVETVVKDNPRIETMMEYRAMQTHLRLRGIEESLNEDIRYVVIEALAKYLEEEPDDVRQNFDLIYRVSSAYATKKNLPRDVIVQLLTKRMKEDILRRQFQDPLEIDGKRIIILKELPRAMIQDRKKYKKLTDKLRQLNIRYRWEIPQGVSFLTKVKGE